MWNLIIYIIWEQIHFYITYDMIRDLERLVILCLFLIWLFIYLSRFFYCNFETFIIRE